MILSSPRQKTIKSLFAVSGNQCYFPNCNTPLVDEEHGTVIGEVCHVKGIKPKSPRYDPDLSDEERHRFNNLVLMCPLHHKIIDSNPKPFTISRLKQIKKDHEAIHTKRIEGSEILVSKLVSGIERKFIKLERILDEGNIILKKILDKRGKANCYLAGSSITKEAVIIDPCVEFESIIKSIEDDNLKPTAILLTHGHPDHWSSINEVKRIYKIPLMYNKLDHIYITKYGADQWLNEGDKIVIGDLILNVLETPGHSLGSLCFYCKQDVVFEDKIFDGIIFTGDLLFSRSVGRTDIQHGNTNQLFTSIKEKIMYNRELTDNFLILPGHLKNTTIGEERELNLFRKFFLTSYEFQLKRKELSINTVNHMIEPKPAYAVISTNVYEEILEVCLNMSLGMEMNPLTFELLSENQIRDFFLVTLNANFEGVATGETFNKRGKTDILIRHQNQNLFIAECKFWKGEKNLLKAVDQLFNYITWRDNKTAILLFNKEKDLSFSTILKKIDFIMKSHSKYKADYQFKSNKLRKKGIFGFILHHPEDVNRDLFLTVMAFNVPKSVN